VLGLLFERLAFLRAVNPAEANPFRMFLMKNFYRIAVEYTDHGAGKFAGHGGWGKPQGKQQCEEQEHPHMVAGWSSGSEEIISTAETAPDTRLDSSYRRRSGEAPQSLLQQRGVRHALAALFELCFLTAPCHRPCFPNFHCGQS
jgi:hypothetical protein